MATAKHLPRCKTPVMKILHYMAVLFQMMHAGIIRNRISKNLMCVSLQVTVNRLGHGSSVKRQHIKEDPLKQGTTALKNYLGPSHSG